MLHEVKLPGIGSISKISSTQKGNDPDVFYNFNSFADPGSFFYLNMQTFKVEKLRDSKLKDHTFKTEDYVTDQVFFKSKDGTKVPMFVTRKKSLLPTLDSKPSKPITTLLYGYGGFTVSQTPKFNPNSIVLLKNLNVMYVVASIRGGGEYGEQWHIDGSNKNKQNSYDDFIGAAEYLI